MPEPLLRPRSPARRRRLPIALALLPALLSLAAAGRTQILKGDPSQARPAELVLLWERPYWGGVQALGVFDVAPVSSDPTLRRLKVWDEKPEQLLVRNESVRCDPEQPLRVTSDGQDLIVRQLNPGGRIIPSNRDDHLIWWAGCHPEHAGEDPAGLAETARQLGYTGLVVETLQRLPGAGR
ncbi:hypothetical protein EVJ50_12020 [Synechococcus sp. RSCCF101]|uniref:hypothetical protein n=1 Tax=Synechococcus sp. RSCCF101 TaxID=2511069 RepID=UPI0012439BDF|nr:hypothetical protein [Synechococcus sp. RSCCF101]QEY32853.1 hypothetical protein EVJ50_12020 [Synechococcus sp. RSCCF101]